MRTGFTVLSLLVITAASASRFGDADAATRSICRRPSAASAKSPSPAALAREVTIPAGPCCPSSSSQR